MTVEHPFTSTELLLMACAEHLYNNFKDTTEKKVIDICLEKRYLTKQDIHHRSEEYQFVEKVFKRDYPAMLLIAPKIEPAIKTRDYQRLLKQSEYFAEAIIESVSKSLMNKQIAPPN
ncbi:hypothetical protein BCV29_13420 [Vibrio cyclitrophicus]|uniref:hypothetical protein n=1 Tax=Vibrio cyclitrophicus TaxID=47951 RepID=UPI001055DE39|nr:hypothetical protein [Vibrio cyclitrophicus]